MHSCIVLAVYGTEIFPALFVVCHLDSRSRRRAMDDGQLMPRSSPKPFIINVQQQLTRLAGIFSRTHEIRCKKDA